MNSARFQTRAASDLAHAASDLAVAIVSSTLPISQRKLAIDVHPPYYISEERLDPQQGEA